MKEKKVGEIRDNIFFLKLLDVTKNAVFIGWAGVYRKEYQNLLKENLKYLRELSTINNVGFDSTKISIVLYVFSEVESPNYISRVYNGNVIEYEEVFTKEDIKDSIEVAKKPISKEDFRPKLSDFFKTVSDYYEWKRKEKNEEILRRIKDFENGVGENPLLEARVNYEGLGNVLNCELSHRSYLNRIKKDIHIFGITCDVCILKTIVANIEELEELKEKIKKSIEEIKEYEKQLQGL